MVSTLSPVKVGNIRDTVRVTTQRPDPSTSTASSGSSASSSPPWMIPDEQGVYLVREQRLERLTVELAASIERAVGLTATLKQPRSLTRVELPAEFVIRAGEGTAAAEFVLLQLFARENRREFRTISASAWNVQGPEHLPHEARGRAPWRIRVRAARCGAHTERHVGCGDVHVRRRRVRPTRILRSIAARCLHHRWQTRDADAIAHGAGCSGPCCRTAIRERA
jgi:hypothetical protein